MHCASCKILVENALIELENVQAVDANVKKWTVWIEYTKKLNLDDVRHVVAECGYEVMDEAVSRPWLSKNVKDYKIALISLFSFFILYILLRHTGIFSWDITSAESPTLWLVLLIGLTAGFSSCMAVIGGLVMAISSKWNQKNEEQSFWKKIIPHFWFNAGRIVWFAILGWVLWIIGKAISISPTIMSVMIGIVGVIMLLLWVNLSQLSPKLSSFSLSLPRTPLAPLDPFMKKDNISSKKKLKTFGSGILTFFLPCGFTFAMQAYAMSTGSFWTGMLVMWVFAIWTLPWLLGVGSLTSVFRGKTAKIAYQVIGILVIILGAYNISNSYEVIRNNLFGSSQECDSTVQVCEINENETAETIQMTYTEDWLSPAELRLKVWKRYKILIDVQTTVYGCMNTIYIPWLDKNMQTLKAGTTVEFDISAKKAGVYEFVCAMGLSHRAKITVE